MKIIVFLVVVGILVCAGAGALYLLSASTVISVAKPPATIGLSTPVSVQVSGTHGARLVAAYIEQNGSRYPLFEKSVPARRVMWQRHSPSQTFAFDAGKNKAPKLKDGKAKLLVEAVSNDFRGDTTWTNWEVNVVLSAPRVIPDDLQHYVNQGGMELVTFNASGSWSDAGAKVGDHEFRSFPLPGGDPNRRFAMFAYSWDSAPDITPTVFARNLAGTEATGHFWFKLVPRKFRVRDFAIDDALMQKLVDSVDPTGNLAPGKDLVTRFLFINREMRRKNNQQLADLRLKTEEKVLWDGPFLHWGKEEADFADVRNYVYHGEKIDQQVHLGFDLSDVQNGPVQAANDGRVVWAADLGIYGNCVVLDHGYALQSIYGHLRDFAVKPGDMVKKGQKLGIAGQTGLAGGVHVHFSMQIDGVQVNPREWWDEHWIKDRVMSKLH